MDDVIERAAHRAGSIDTIDADTYFQWLQLAYKARAAGEDVVVALRAAGTPDADAQAIACGLDLPDEPRSVPAAAARIVSDGLPDHGIDERRSITRRVGRPSSRVRYGRRVAVGAALIAVAAGGVLALIHRPSERRAAPPARPASQQHAAAAIENRPTSIPRQQRDSERASPSESPPALTKHARPLSRDTSLKQTDDAPAHTTPAPAPMGAARPESCPPGVDRLGCPGAAGRIERESSCPNGFSRAGSSCVPAAMPQHAHAIPTGFGWECDVGFIQTGRICTKLRVPPNAHVDFTGRSWECDSGYELAGESCRPS
ncbi:hypothetical protein [Burkholderia sp. BCC0397]|uniref:hypothetical protein n=1 Tax=Burkholderia sp. BCC0397 TaxID=486876 RepID=UPI00158E5850|nr:hypothetical protein [Burkholderia sp. BCC0397]